MINNDNYRGITQLAKENQAQLVAVTKTRPQEAIQQLYDLGQRIMGENRVQEMVEKQANLPDDIAWHLIGHLQTNKVKYIAPFVAMIHAVDSIKLLQEIDKRAKEANRVIPCLLQFHIAQEDSKYGLHILEAQTMLGDRSLRELKNVRIAGVMGMATNTDDQAQIQREFQNLKEIFDTLQAQYFADSPEFKEISMGMSGDYELALQEGSTMIRVGSKLYE